MSHFAKQLAPPGVLSLALAACILVAASDIGADGPSHAAVDSPAGISPTVRLSAAGPSETVTAQAGRARSASSSPPAAGRAGGESAQQFFDAGLAEISDRERTVPIRGRARGVILFVGDGMSVGTVTAARIHEGQQKPGNRGGEENLLFFETFPHLALARTYQANQQVPDSAPTATALLTGAKTGDGMLGVAPNVPRGDAARAMRRENQLMTILERAEREGLSTGIVTTTRVSHATPASAYAHVPERGWESDADLPEEARAAGFPDIARQLVEFPKGNSLGLRGDGPEVVLGGGRTRFLPETVRDPEDPVARGQRRDARDLTIEWVRGTHRPGGRRGVFVTTKRELEALDAATAPPVLGLFQPGHMNYEYDRPHDAAGEPSLTEMTAFAVKALSRNPRGFFLLVEGGRIDHAHHDRNAFRALGETIEFSRAVRRAAEMTNPQDTLILVTADHSTPFTISGYARRGNPIFGQVRQTGDEPARAANPFELDLEGRPFTTLSYRSSPRPSGASAANRPAAAPPAAGDPKVPDSTAPDYRQGAPVYLDSETHSGEDVPVYARGPWAFLVSGVMEQNALYHVMARALGFQGRW